MAHPTSAADDSQTIPMRGWPSPTLLAWCIVVGQSSLLIRAEGSGVDMGAGMVKRPTTMPTGLCRGCELMRRAACESGRLRLRGGSLEEDSEVDDRVKLTEEEAVLGEDSEEMVDKMRARHSKGRFDELAKGESLFLDCRGLPDVSAVVNHLVSKDGERISHI